ncbi:MAG: hypothetical protein QGI45_07670 [Myxococcota bacterium]|nr:hypothetical protein [Myxococcota bacterium]
MSSHEPLGLLLVREELITRPQLYDGLRLQRRNSKLLGSCLIELGFLDPEALLDILSRQLSLPPLPPGSLDEIEPDALAKISGDMAKRLRLVPYSWDGDVLGVAVADGSALGKLEEVSTLIGSPVGAYLAIESEIEAALENHYGDGNQNALDSEEPVLLESPAQSLGKKNIFMELSNQDLDHIFEDEENDAPVVLDLPKSEHGTNRLHGAQAVLASAPESKKIDVLDFYGAVDRAFTCLTADDIAECLGSGYLNYFSRVLVLGVQEDAIHVAGYNNIQPFRGQATKGISPHLALCAAQDKGGLVAVGGNALGREIAQCFGFEEGKAGLLALLAGRGKIQSMVYADAHLEEELPADMNEVEFLQKEAQTALSLLVEFWE